MLHTPFSFMRESCSLPDVSGGRGRGKKKKGKLRGSRFSRQGSFLLNSRSLGRIALSSQGVDSPEYICEAFVLDVLGCRYRAHWN